MGHINIGETVGIKIKPSGNGFEMGLGSSFLERVVIPYANSPSTNPGAKIVIIPLIASIK
jgi:hypothetical protein